jgi:hypothetical protein
MAKQTWNNPIDKTVDWGGDATTGHLPVSGEMVQRFIKESLNGKAGLFHYDATNNRYLVFADADARDEYLLDPTKTELIIGTFDAPFNYTAEINLTSSAYNAVFLGSTGNYIDFTFDIKNKQGASTGENVTVTYTFIRNAVRQSVTETRKFGDAVHFNVDKYIGEGTNTIMVGITGQTSLAATTVAITYQVVNLTIEDELDIAKSYNLTNGSQQIEIPFTVSGYGTKVVEWYLDGEMLPFIKVEDEVVDVIATRTKYITLSNLQQGTHSLQMRAYSLVNGEKFYTDTLYRDIIVYTGVSSDVIIGVATTISRDFGVLGANDNVTIYDMVQYIPYTLRFATYSPSNAANTEVTIKLDGVVKGVVNSSNGIENKFILTSTSSGNKVLNLSASGISKDIPTIVQETDMNIQEITNGLVLDFNASGKTNNSSDRDTWTDGIHTGTLEGFNWNNASGWVDGRLEMNAGASLAIDLAPLAGKPTDTGKTIEIEWSTKNVMNDNAVICDLRDANGVGILITATKVSMTSADGVVVETEYKSDENVRIGFVINRATGTTNKRISFIYANGIVSRAEQWAETDSYTSSKTILFTASEEAEVSLKSIRVYEVALTSDNMLNNYTLYRDTIAEMMEVYDRNDVYEEGTTIFSTEKMMGRLPVMIVTGDIPTLENTSDKDTQIVVDIEYYNMQYSSKSFTMKNAAMRPQGTSSMGYPKKNFRIYTQKVANTEVYDSVGNPIADKLYSFKDGAQPVNCWCLKADYAESSGTHNTGIARLWNEALYNAQIDGEYKLRTEAQKKAEEAGYPYDVRTTIDGFPILLFYRPSANDDLIFIGKYNFNNDKSTESVFGFKGIPNFNNEKMQCWEVLNNGNALALFTSVEGFDSDWSEAFESRYPDTKTPYTGDLKAFCEWMASVSQKDFATEKWQHLNVYMMAAYWVYLMRHAAADQFVKNAMFTSEDGQHFYYILYDNDTINGLINTGRLRIKPTDDRQTVDETGSYVFAGHDSRLWNMLEADDEFRDIVSAVDNALYSAGISYANTIRIFDEEQADKWVEKVYNQDAQYKYVGPYVEKGIDNLFMLQGKRDLHRRWWLAKRFSIYDAKYVSGTYKSQAIEIKCLNGTEAGQKFSIVAGYPLDYGYGINNVPRDFGVSLGVGDAYEFTTEEVINLGDPVRIYGAPNIAEIDFSKMSDRLAVVTIANVYDENLGTKLTKIVLGNASKSNYEVTEISGLKQAEALEQLDVQGMTKINSLDLSNHKYFKTLKAKGSGVSSIAFAKGAPVEKLELPSSMRVLALSQLPYLDKDNIAFENIANIQQINVSACPNITDDFNFVYNWYANKSASNINCSLVMDGVVWENIDSAKFLDLCNIKLEGGELSLKGKVSIPNATLDVIYAIKEVFGDTSFYPNAELYIEVPVVLGIKSNKDSILEGENLQLTHEIYPVHQGTFTYSIVQGREGCSINPTTGLLTTTEKAIDTSDVVVELSFVSTDGKIVINTQKAIQVVRRTYPSSITITGSGELVLDQVYHLTMSTDGVTGDFSVEWGLSGDIASYYTIDDFMNDDYYRMLIRKSIPEDTTTGTLWVNIRRNFDNTIVISDSLSLRYAIVWPTGVTIDGYENPVENPNYTADFEGDGITGVYEGSWDLSGDIVNYVQIESQTNTSCAMKIIDAPIEFVNGTLTYSLKKKYNGAIIATATKSLRAIIEGVVITAKSNAPIQASLYEAGLVANEVYSLKEELERITANQLQPGSSVTTSIFYAHHSEIEHFEEFEYFTAVTTIKPYTFGSTNYFKNFKTVKLPPNLTSIGKNAFDSSGIQEVLFNNKLNTIGQYAFYSTKLLNIILPSSVTTISDHAFANCMNLQLLDLSQTKITTITSNSNLKALKIVKFPSTIKTIGRWQFYSAYLSDIYCDAVVAPIAEEYGNSAFASASSGIVGSSATHRFLHIPFNATGYDDNGWEALFGNAKYNIYGKLTITSNRSNAKFDVTYVTESDVTKTINVGVGTVYINDIKYNTEVTIVPKALGQYEWSEPSKTFVYNNSTQEHTFNAYVYPDSITVSGPQYIIGGDTVTYVATISPSNVDAELKYSWLFLSGNESTLTYEGNTCTVVTAATDTEQTFLAQCVVRSDKGTVSNLVQGNVVPRPNFITATYNVTSTTSATELVNIYFNVSDITYMEVDGVVVTPSLSYTFSSTGIHTVRFSVETIHSLFSSVGTLTSVDFSECDGAKYTSARTLFQSCTALTTINWGECTFPNITDISSLIRNDNLETVDLSPFKDAPITDISYMCYGCKKLKSIDLNILQNTSIVNIECAFYNCSNITSIDFSEISFSDSIQSFYSLFYYCTSLSQINWGDHKFKGTTKLNSTFMGCSSLSSIDLSPFDEAKITDVNNLFNGCSSLSSIDLSPLVYGSIRNNNTSLFRSCVNLKTIIAPWSTAPTMSSSAFGSSNANYVGRNTYNKGENKLYVPAGATGYDTGYWLDPLQNSSKCGFTLSATL